jgi:hypothetical protein
MAHTLISHSISQLEEFFAASRENPQALQELEDELRYRQVPHALRLLVKIQGALRGASVAKGTATGAGPEAGAADALH